MDSEAQVQTEEIVESALHFGQQVLVITRPDIRVVIKINSIQSIAFNYSDKSSRFVRGYVIKHNDEGTISFLVNSDQVDKIIYNFDYALGASYE